MSMQKDWSLRSRLLTRRLRSRLLWISFHLSRLLKKSILTYFHNLKWSMPVLGFLAKTLLELKLLTAPKLRFKHPWRLFLERLKRRSGLRITSISSNMTWLRNCQPIWSLFLLEMSCTRKLVKDVVFTLNHVKLRNVRKSLRTRKLILRRRKNTLVWNTHFQNTTWLCYHQASLTVAWRTQSRHSWPQLFWLEISLKHM